MTRVTAVNPALGGKKVPAPARGERMGTDPPWKGACPFRRSAESDPNPLGPDYGYPNSFQIHGRITAWLGNPAEAGLAGAGNLIFYRSRKGNHSEFAWRTIQSFSGTSPLSKETDRYA
jgi:hypothetical protein